MNENCDVSRKSDVDLWRRKSLTGWRLFKEMLRDVIIFRNGRAEIFHYAQKWISLMIFFKQLFRRLFIKKQTNFFFNCKIRFSYVKTVWLYKIQETSLKNISIYSRIYFEIRDDTYYSIRILIILFNWNLKVQNNLSESLNLNIRFIIFQIQLIEIDAM